MIWQILFMVFFVFMAYKVGYNVGWNEGIDMEAKWADHYFKLWIKERDKEEIES